jgi:hypothetical protein
MIQQIKDMPAGTLGFRAVGKVRREDYENILVPDVEAVFALNRKLRLLYHLGPDFDGFELGALWDETKLGLRHLNDWDRVAVVTDESWVRTLVKTGVLAPAQSRMFANAEYDAAMAWIEEGEED